MSQEPVLYGRTIHENIAYGLDDCSEEQVRQAAISANAHQFIMEMKDQYQTQTGEKGVQLSGQIYWDIKQASFTTHVYIYISKYIYIYIERERVKKQIQI